MNTRITLPVLIIAFASAGAYVWPPEAVPETASAHAATAEAFHHPVARLAHHEDHDAAAMHDMTLHAVRHLGTTDAKPASFRAWPEWTPGWELRALDFEAHGHTETVYQATSKHQPHVRFTITASSDSLEWERAE